MRIYSSPFEAMKETERECWEMSIEVHPESMQDKRVADDPAYWTKELRGYSFIINSWTWDPAHVKEALEYFWPGQSQPIAKYIDQELLDRVSPASNPGNSYLHRQDLWKEFLHDGKFAYTYSERIAPQLQTILHELQVNPNTRQAIINIHSNICPEEFGQVKHAREKRSINRVAASADLNNRGGGGRIPCSMYYQVLLREGKVDLIYTMRSCDFLVHFPIDILLALGLQNWLSLQLHMPVGRFTYFVGSLHAYFKDLQVRGIF
jgi:thymidylate synthase